MDEVLASVDLNLTTESGVPIVRPKGEIDWNNSPSFRTQLLALADGNPSKVIVDLADVTHVDSSGVGTLVEFMRHLDKSNGGRVVLTGLQPTVRGLFEITNLDQFFTIVENLDEAHKK